jgi:hypothetical protein
LLAKQTHAVGSRYDSVPGLIHFIGPLVDLGNFATFVTDNDSTRDVTIKLEFDSGSQPLPEVLRTTFSFGLSRDTSRLTPDVEAPALCLIKRIDFEYLSPSAKIKSWETHLASFIGGRPEYRLRISRDKIRAHREISPFVQSSEDLTYVFSTVLNGLSAFVVPANSRFDGKPHRFGAYLPPSSGPLAELQLASRLFDAEMSAIEYVGTTRAAAKRYYYASGDTATQDHSGENLPSILLSKKLQKVSYVSPGPDRTAKEATLGEAVSDWVCYLRTGEFARPPEADEYDASSADNILLTLKVKSPVASGLHSLVDVGFGYSQVLPILLAGLLTNEGGVIIVEQPELHLNPALQVRMAEFFVSLVRGGKQVLVETHSEHIVNTIRVLAAEDITEDENKHLSHLSSVLYFEPTSTGPSIFDMNIREDGSFPDWPPDFFGESLNLSSRLMKAQRRFVKRGTL